MNDPNPPKPPDWNMPQPGEIYPADAQQRIDNATLEMRTAIIAGMAAGVAGRYGLSFDLTNPLLRNAIQQLGQKITLITEAQRDEIMHSLQDAYDEGLSIERAARKMVADSVVSTESRATMIARTELTSATSMGSLSAARLVDSASPGTSMLKGWISAQDDRVRPDHEDADAEYSGSGIPLDQPFIVGGEELQHPGDPNGSAEQIISCRCSVIYMQGEGDTNTLGVTAAAAPSPHAITDHSKEIAAALEAEFQPRLEEAYRRVLRALARDAARNFRSLNRGRALTAASATRRFTHLRVRRVIRP